VAVPRLIVAMSLNMYESVSERGGAALSRIERQTPYVSEEVPRCSGARVLAFGWSSRHSRGGRYLACCCQSLFSPVALFFASATVPGWIHRELEMPVEGVGALTFSLAESIF
jgi:hypothetical protein